MSGNNQTYTDILNQEGIMVIGYYPFRGKAQICRLLCQYLHLPYKNLMFTPRTWQEFKNAQNLNWTFDDLPFLKDGDTIVTETYPICLYLLHKANRKDLLGGNLEQEIKLDSIVWQAEPVSYITTNYINHRDLTPEVKVDALGKLWSRCMQEKLTKLEKSVSGTGYYLKELSLVDFYLHETFYFLKIVTPEKLYQFPKLLQITNKFLSIPEIRAYEKSKACVREVCPIKFCNTWRERCKEAAQQ